MKRRSLWQVSVAVEADAEEAVSRLLSDWFGTPACAVYDARNGTTTVSVFLERRPQCQTLKNRAFRSGLRALVARPDRRVRLRLRRLAAQDWAESWKRHFRPRLFGNTLLLKPSWSRCRPRRGQVAVVLDPGLSFGTGQHPTTAFCLREIVRHRPVEGRRSFLDVGTGSGILAIAAAKLGYAPVEGFDLDPDALRVARANAARNSVLDRLRLWQGDLAAGARQTRRRYDLVCANLLTPVLIAAARRLADCLRPDGRLVAAGVLEAEFRSLQTAFAQVGLRLGRSRRDGPWRAGTFIRQPAGDDAPGARANPARGRAGGRGKPTRGRGSGQPVLV